MDEFNKIRKARRVDGKSINSLAIEYNRSWATINKAINMSDSDILKRGKRERKNRVITQEVIDEINKFIDFEIDKKVHRKQKFTSVYIYKELTRLGIYSGSSKRLRTIIAHLRKEKKQHKKESFIELDFEFGHYIQFDHGPVELILKEHRIDGYLFVASVPGFSLRYCQFYATKAKEAWGDFHELTFKFFGGIFPNAIYDNDSVLKNNHKNIPTDFCLELQIHYGFESVFCNKAKGNEKGAVEGSVGYCRRNFLAGLPEFNSIQEVNAHLEESVMSYLIEKTHYKTKRPLIDYFNELHSSLRSLSAQKIWGRWEELKADKFQKITYLGHGYSVPERYIGSKLKVFIGAFTLDLYDGVNYICSHDRVFIENEDSLKLDHYLDSLLKKPRSIPFSKVIKKQKFQDSILNFWVLLKHRYPEKDANVQFIKGLMLRRRSTQVDFETAIELSISYGAASYNGLKSILHQLQISQVRSIENGTETESLSIESHFDLEKYNELQEVYSD